MTNEDFLYELATAGEKPIQKAEKLLAELLEEYGSINKIPAEKMKKVHSLANSGGGFLDKNGRIWQHHPH